MAIGVKVKKAIFTSVPEVIVERTNRLPYNLQSLNSTLRNLLTSTSSILSVTTLGKQIRNSCAFEKQFLSGLGNRCIVFCHASLVKAIRKCDSGLWSENMNFEKETFCLHFSIHYSNLNSCHRVRDEILRSYDQRSDRYKKSRQLASL